MMKRSTAPLAALVVLLAANAPAQAQTFAIDRGSLLIDGQASFTSTGSDIDGVDDDSDRFTQLSLSPSVQYFFTRGLAIGGEVLLARTSLGGEAIWAYGIGPAATYYFGDAERTWYPYLGASLLFTSQSSDDDDTTQFGYRGAAGAAFMVARNVGIGAELFYAATNRETGDFEVDTDQFGLAVGIAVFVY